MRLTSQERVAKICFRKVQADQTPPSNLDAMAVYLGQSLQWPAQEKRKGITKERSRHTVAMLAGGPEGGLPR